ncbi:hypothetical protein KAM380_082280 [Aeromonas caviae]|nr:hypothetical protein KAM380_082280 [Aeromonas caviae]
MGAGDCECTWGLLPQGDWPGLAQIESQQPLAASFGRRAVGRPASGLKNAIFFPGVCQVFPPGYDYNKVSPLIHPTNLRKPA